MKRIYFFLTALLISPVVKTQVNIDYFLPKDITYNKEIPTPKQFTGHEVGEWHLTHDKLCAYMIELASLSDRAVWEEYGRSYENRPLGQLIISSPENIKNIEKLRQQHILLCDPQKSAGADIKNMPLFIRLGYGIHGNESSGQNASVLTAYYLIAGEGGKIDELLKNTVVMIDPSLNPDGMQRHSTWVNSTRSLNNNPDPNSLEFNEPWPGGRTNHYWFDLNRDYLMPQHPESIGRLESFYKWRPNIITDHHEMSANSTFFFQPGVTSRNNPLTPTENQELTAEIAKYHEKYLNEIGSLYFSEESYDDFYVGKGSAYPDIHGSVGILFEQAGVKGHLKETPGGLISFPFAIRNQFTVSLSTLEAGLKMKDKLLASQRDFYKDAIIQADKYSTKAFVFTEPSDKGRTSEFIKNMIRHHIRVYKLARDIKQDGVDYKADNSYIIPLKQNEYRFIRSIFEPVKEFSDSLFYDISTWVVPMSFNIQYAAINATKVTTGLEGEEILDPPASEGVLTASENSYAYLFEWNEYYAPKALYRLQNAGVVAKVATDKFVCTDGKTEREFSYGTIMIHASEQNMSSDDLFKLMGSVAKDCGITIYGVSTGATPKGIDLGSNAFITLKKPSVVMFTGDGSNSSEAGEIWHMLDTRFNIPVTMVSPAKASAVNFDRYNVLIITGSPEISPSVIENIITWTKKGGTLIAYGSANTWLSKNKLAQIEFVPEAVPDVKEGIYVNRRSDVKAQEIPGSIFETKLDLSHPLCYGYTRKILPVMKTTATVVKKDPDVYNNPIVYTSDPLLSGYCSKKNAERIKGTPFASVHGDRIISIYDNTNFRAVWYGTNKIFMNAVFFGQVIVSK
ncbi:MAG TPA: M14 family zinc carboxypeptidase [Bacteroidales bacterium]|nr:M14 family zinc carboxypeptidase [Bacteroidales bacterium]